MSQVAAHTLSPGAPGGPLVVYAHGLEDTWRSWRPMARQADPRWRQVALDLPWRPGNDYTWRYRASGKWLGDGLDLVDATPDVLVAHSFGANATLQLLCAMDRRPGRAVALVCPLYRQPAHQVSWRTFDRSRAVFVEHIREGLLARMGERAETIEPSVLGNMIDLVIDRVGPAGFLTVFDQFVASGYLPLDKVDVPALVLAGGGDPTLSRETVTELAQSIRGATLRIVDEYDHFCHVRHASGVVHEVADLVSAARTTTRTAGDLR